MRLPEFDHASKQWDRFKAFHVPGGNCWSVGFGHYQGDASSCFIQFESGSLMLLPARYHNRQVHKKFGLAIGTPQELSSWGATFLQEDGSHMPTAWLYKDSENDTLSPTLVLDIAKQRAYKVACWGSSSDEYIGAVPKYAHDGQVFWANEESDPVTRAKVRVARPSRFQSDDMKEYLARLRPMAQAVLTLEHGSNPIHVSKWLLSNIKDRIKHRDSWEQIIARAEAVRSDHWPTATTLAACAVMQVKCYRPESFQEFVHVDIKPGSTLHNIRQL